MRATAPAVEEDRWLRYAPIAGILFVLGLIAFALLLFGSGVKASDPPVVVSASILHHYRRFEAITYVATVFVICWAVYLAAVWLWLRGRAERTGFLALLTLIGGVGADCLHAVGDGGISGVLGARIVSSTTVATTYSLFLVWQAIDAMGDVLWGTFFFGAGLWILARGGFPNWVAWLGIVAGVLLVLGGFSLGGVTMNILFWLDLLGFVVALVFVLATSVMMLMRTGAVPTPEAAEKIGA